jgi:TolA-binding protein
MATPILRPSLLLATALASSMAGSAARAQDNSETRLNSLERQIRALESELQHVKRDMAVHNQQVKALAQQAARAQAVTETHSVLQPGQSIPPGYALVPASPGATPGSVVLAKTEAPEGPPLPMGSFRVGNVTVTLGGFIEAAGIFRSRNEVADIASNFNTGIPLRNSPNYHQSETRFSARQSRISGMVQAKPNPDTTLTAYAETDFISAAPTANSVESDSYNLRLRQAYAVYDRSDLGLYVMGGQAWSLLTLQKQGIGYLTPNIDSPLVIDAQYVPGFTWARQPQLRVAKTLDGGLFTIAGSLENPQTNYYTGPNGLAPSSVGTISVNSPGGSGFASTNNYSADVAPDIIGKIAFDPSFGHFEAYGVARFMRDRVSQTGSGSNSTVTGGGGGAGAVVHLIPKYLDIQGSFLAGDGIGRYGSAQLPDAVVGADGHPEVLPEVEALVGVIGHPDPAIDLYGYIGTEQISARYFAADVKGTPTGFGYGSPLYANAGCDIELGTSSDCVGNTSGITQGTLGTWWKFVHGPYGTMQVGAQYSYTHRTIFQGVGPTPKTDDNMVFLSFRYYPFQ